MKWVITSTISLFICSFLFSSAAAASETLEEQGFQGFKNIYVVQLPTSKFSISRSLDRKAINVSFANFADEIRSSIDSVILSSPLSLRWLPIGRTGIIAQIYSPKKEIEYSVHSSKKGAVLWVGEMREEISAAPYLSIVGSKDPVPQVAEWVRTGKFADALRALHEKNGKNLLKNKRFELVNFLNHGPDTSECPKIKAVSTRKQGDLEALLTAAWCEQRRLNTDKALYYIDIIKKFDRGSPASKYASALEEEIAISRILTANRLRETIETAAYSIRHIKIIKSLPTDVELIEAVASALSAFDLAGPFSRLIQGLIAKDTSKNADALKPLLVESYLLDDKPLLAMDSAMYFLARHRSNVIAARLHRGLGLAKFQLGDWSGAETALMAAKSKGAELGVDELSALLEAKLRARKPVEELNLLLEEIKSSGQKLNDYQESILNRLSLEIGLRAGVAVSDKAISILPSHVLFDAANTLQTQGKTEKYQGIMKELAKSETGWGELARVSLEIDEMKEKTRLFKSIAEKL